MALIRKLLSITVAIIILCSILACSISRSPGAGQANTQSNQQNFTWSITLKKSETADNLNNTESAVQYNGDTVQISYQEIPADGNTFLLLELVIEKVKSGASKFEWERVYVSDSAGKKYHRHPNDTFLESFNFERIKSTDLTFGKNEGFICFEISKLSTKGKMYLIYDSPEGKNQIILN